MIALDLANDFARPLISETFAALVEDTKDLSFDATRHYLLNNFPKYIDDFDKYPQAYHNRMRAHWLTNNISTIAEETLAAEAAKPYNPDNWFQQWHPSKTTTWTAKECLLAYVLGPTLWSWEDQQGVGRPRVGRPRAEKTPEEEAERAEKVRAANAAAQARYRAARAPVVNPEWTEGTNYITKLKSDMRVYVAKTRKEILECELYLATIPKHLAPHLQSDRPLQSDPHLQTDRPVQTDRALQTDQAPQK